MRQAEEAEGAEGAEEDANAKAEAEHQGGGKAQAKRTIVSVVDILVAPTAALRRLSHDSADQDGQTEQRSEQSKGSDRPCREREQSKGRQEGQELLNG
jgi:hypothetical protein